ncbi:MAG: hypothetical protein AB1746_04180 [Candidatus Zixiibacteriota bacterium]
MQNYIPFIFGDKDIEILIKEYPKAKCIRLPLDKANLVEKISHNKSIWLDANIDIYSNWPPSDQRQREFYQKYDPDGLIPDDDFAKKPNKNYIKKFIKNLLDDSLKCNPYLLTVPQMPITNRINRDKINRLFVEMTRECIIQSNFNGKLIFPLLISHQNLVNQKANRDKVIGHAVKCFSILRMDGIWTVEYSLDDSTGSDTIGNKRLKNLIKLHNSLKKELPINIINIAGPYWASNLILWARELITDFAIGLGRGYRYYPPGGIILPGKVRIAIPPLYRWNIIDSELEKWLKDALKRIPSEHSGYRIILNILKNIGKYEKDKDAARLQIAQFYKEWIERLENIPPEGRALALYQEFSNAFVLGRTIKKKMPDSAKPARAPEKVVQQFMFNTL